MQVNDFLDRLARVRRLPNGKWQASCPTPAHQHGDRSRGLNVCTADDGRLLVYCHAGCSIENIMAAMGLTLADLFPRRNQRPGAGAVRNPRTFSRDIATALAHDAVLASLALEYAQKGLPVSPGDTQSMAAASGRLFRFAQRMEASL
jgi:hypothetical protein